MPTTTDRGVGCLCMSETPEGNRTDSLDSYRTMPSVMAPEHTLDRVGGMVEAAPGSPREPSADDGAVADRATNGAAAEASESRRASVSCAPISLQLGSLKRGHGAFDWLSPQLNRKKKLAAEAASKAADEGNAPATKDALGCDDAKGKGARTKKTSEGARKEAATPIVVDDDEGSRPTPKVNRSSGGGIQLGRSKRKGKGRLFSPCAASKPIVIDSDSDDCVIGLGRRVRPKPVATQVVPPQPPREVTDEDRGRMGALAQYLKSHLNVQEDRLERIDVLEEYLRCQSRNRGLPWAQRYTPVNTDMSLAANAAVCSRMQEWLLQWCTQTPVENSDDDFVSEDEGCGIAVDKRSLLITGPSGCGKTATIQAIARVLGRSIVEINSNEGRTGAMLKKKVQEATQSSSCKGGRAGKALKVLVVEEVDSVVEEDQGFLPALAEIVKTTRCPVIMTANVNSLPTYLAQLVENTQFKRASVQELVYHAGIVCIAEGLNPDIEALHGLALESKGDYRRCMNGLHFWLSSKVQPPLKEFVAGKYVGHNPTDTMHSHLPIREDLNERLMAEDGRGFCQLTDLVSSVDCAGASCGDDDNVIPHARDAKAMLDWVVEAQMGGRDLLLSNAVEQRDHEMACVLGDNKSMLCDLGKSLNYGVDGRRANVEKMVCLSQIARISNSKAAAQRRRRSRSNHYLAYHPFFMEQCWVDFLDRLGKFESTRVRKRLKKQCDA